MPCWQWGHWQSRTWPLLIAYSGSKRMPTALVYTHTGKLFFDES